MALRASSDFLAIADLLQATASSGGTGRIVAQSGDYGRAEVYFHEGAVVHACYADLEGPQAVYALVAGTGLQYEVEPGVAAPRQTVEAPIQELLLEAARLQDEGRLRYPSVVESHRPAQERIPVAAEPVPPEPRRRAVGWVLLSVVLVVVVGLVAVAAGREVAATLGLGGASGAPAGGAVESAPVVAGVYEASALVGDGDRPPELLYGPTLRAPKPVALMPSVVLRVLVSRTGTVGEATIVRPRPEFAEFEQLASEAVRHFVFEPAVKAGTPVASWVNVPVAFAWDDRGVEAIRIKGSETIGAELAPALARAYEDVSHSALVTVEALGSSTAFTGLLDGSAEIGASSRSMIEAELAKAEGLNLRLREFVIGYDGVVVVVHWSNPVESLSLQQLADLYSGETQRWSELGGLDLPVVLVGRPAYSGTHVFLKQRLFGDGADAAHFSPQVESVESAQALVERVLIEPGAIGYVSLGALDDRVKTLAVSESPSEGAVLPSIESVRLGTYPLHRPLRLYARARMTHETVAFLRFVLGAAGQRLIEQEGFVPVEVSQTASSPTFEDAVDDVPAARITRIHFEHGHNRLNPAAKKVVAQLASSLRARDTLLVVGNADAGGSAAENAKAAHARAVAVAREIEASGIATDRIEVRSEAAAVPVATNTTSDGRRENRRVDIFVFSR